MISAYKWFAVYGCGLRRERPGIHLIRLEYQSISKRKILLEISDNVVSYFTYTNPEYSLTAVKPNRYGGMELGWNRCTCVQICTVQTCQRRFRCSNYRARTFEPKKCAEDTRRIQPEIQLENRNVWSESPMNGNIPIWWRCIDQFFTVSSPNAFGGGGLQDSMLITTASPYFWTAI